MHSASSLLQEASFSHLTWERSLLSPVLPMLFSSAYLIPLYSLSALKTTPTLSHRKALLWPTLRVPFFFFFFLQCLLFSLPFIEHFHVPSYHLEPQPQTSSSRIEIVPCCRSGSYTQSKAPVLTAGVPFCATCSLCVFESKWKKKYPFLWPDIALYAKGKAG